MNKSRFEAFSDAIIAIIVTIMVLEIKTPSSPKLISIVDQAPYFLAYIASFISIGTAWYDNHYMISITKRITKKIYWLNNLWLFSMSLLPLATSWVGKFIDYSGPEIFYLLIFNFWSLTFKILSTNIAKELEAENGHPEKIYKMRTYKYLKSKMYYPLNLLILIATLFFPPTTIIYALLSVLFSALKTNKDSDHIFD